MNTNRLTPLFAAARASVNVPSVFTLMNAASGSSLRSSRM
jgi:hypothetical protein